MFKAQTKNKSWNYIKVLCSNRWGEFTSNEFYYFCKENWNKMQLTTSQTLQQNNVAKRKNGIIVELAQSMMKYKGFQNTYWYGNIISIITYLLNRYPIHSIWNKTPQEAWSGRHHNVSHLKIFRCIAYAHIPKENRHKFDDKS